MFREAALDWISVLKSTDIRKLAKDPLTPDFPVPNAVADTLPAQRHGCPSVAAAGGPSKHC